MLPMVVVFGPDQELISLSPEGQQDTSVFLEGNEKDEAPGVASFTVIKIVLVTLEYIKTDYTCKSTAD